MFFVKSIFNPAILSFGLGVFFSIWRKETRPPSWMGTSLSYVLLVMIGIKGGLYIAGNIQNTPLFYRMTLVMIGWGLIQPFLLFVILRKLIFLKRETAAAIAGSFGSISLMTFITASFYLEKFETSYAPFMVAILAIMEIPGIISALCIIRFKKADNLRSLFKIISHSLFNKAILAILLGGLIGYMASVTGYTNFFHTMDKASPIVLTLFLLNMGLSVGLYKDQLKNLGIRLACFGVSAPFLGGVVGLFLAWFLKTDVGTGTMMAVLSASASYIAVPATMRIALPEAEEGIYLPLSIGITFPFNILIGIPIYYHLAARVLS